ncbi:MAG: hypothetical protein A2932_01105 [Candidatus Spechtbacteria bacterium RIFCSPLOWO2_01_FULL_46_10]|uniref:MBL fold hydrolase n=1 Tax=Candidatus Spechtbacteria bacterium RIFCSPLOWO2_01_FULL_46_10 TaxID=1802163 RepID=A0A1G2HFQ0_9BACT|nr:MAG: hypothetical protein A2932_01105 [Candidatus Spechtbacteria bacterium RIFCSPLOWO2_01_FULL_46_10]
MAKLTFYGGALSVTGSNYLIETKKSKVLVDVGMFQGGAAQRKKNYKKFPYDPKNIDAVCITHAHIDHTGRLPKLVKDGFNKQIYATEPTVGLSAVMLKDSAHIIAEEMPPGEKPLYSIGDVKRTARHFQGIAYNKEVRVTDDIRVRFRDAGHILGSAIIEVFVKEDNKETKIVFSGDLGNPPSPLLNLPTLIDGADYVLVESTYGNRRHEDRQARREFLENAIEDTVTEGGILMVPAFALERTQEMLFELNSLVEHNRIPNVPIFIDSPLAIDATKVYARSDKYFSKRAKYLIERGDDLFNFPNLKFTYTTEESKKINDVPPPKVILAGSGMSTAGRILHHERRYLRDPKSTLLIVGYQAEGTLGRKLLDGAKTVRLFGEKIPVRAHIRAIGGYSAHADKDALFTWVNHIRRSNPQRLKKVFCVQGEREAAKALATKFHDFMAIDAVVPKPGDVFKF